MTSPGHTRIASEKARHGLSLTAPKETQGTASIFRAVNSAARNED